MGDEKKQQLPEDNGFGNRFGYNDEISEKSEPLTDTL